MWSMRRRARTARPAGPIKSLGRGSDKKSQSMKRQKQVQRGCLVGRGSLWFGVRERDRCEDQGGPVCGMLLVPGGGRQIARGGGRPRGGGGGRRRLQGGKRSHHPGIRDDHLRPLVYYVLRSSAETVTSRDCRTGVQRPIAWFRCVKSSFQGTQDSRRESLVIS